MRVVITILIIIVSALSAFTLSSKKGFLVAVAFVVNFAIAPLLNVHTLVGAICKFYFTLVLILLMIGRAGTRWSSVLGGVELNNRVHTTSFLHRDLWSCNRTAFKFQILRCIFTYICTSRNIIWCMYVLRPRIKTVGPFSLLVHVYVVRHYWVTSTALCVRVGKIIDLKLCSTCNYNQVHLERYYG